MAKSRIWVVAALVAVLVALVVAPLTATAAPSEWGGSGCRLWHTVCYGETLGSIASYYGTSVWAVANANGIANIDYVRSGRSLCIPYGSTRIGYGYGPDYGPGYGHGPSYGGGCWYKIRYGDTLANIAWRYGTTTSYLRSWNGISNANWIYAGRWLRVPCYSHGGYGYGGGGY